MGSSVIDFYVVCNRCNEEHDLRNYKTPAILTDNSERFAVVRGALQKLGFERKKFGVFHSISDLEKYYAFLHINTRPVDVVFVDAEMLNSDASDRLAKLNGYSRVWEAPANTKIYFMSARKAGGRPDPSTCHFDVYEPGGTERGGVHDVTGGEDSTLFILRARESLCNKNLPRGILKTVLHNTGSAAIDDVLAAYNDTRPSRVVIELDNGVLDSAAGAIMDGIREIEAKKK
jgi:hypothetical protein